MIRPRTYPELVGKALVLEAEPFAVMTDDDTPWVEGLFLIVCLGVAVGLAQFIGGVLLTASLPPVEALREASMIFMRQAAAYFPLPMLDPLALETTSRQIWDWFTFASGYGSGWTRLVLLISTPAILIVIWLVYSAISFVAARWLGGVGTFDQTLGVSALIFAPQVLLLLTAIPFVVVGWPLLWGWALLIGFRGLEVAHDLSWQRSVLAALAAPAMLLLLLIGGALALSFIALLGGIA